MRNWWRVASRSIVHDWVSRLRHRMIQLVDFVRVQNDSTSSVAGTPLHCYANSDPVECRSDYKSERFKSYFPDRFDEPCIAGRGVSSASRQLHAVIL